MNQSVTCVIPFFNEGPRLLKVIRIVVGIPEVANILCIDDGSTDNTGVLVKKKYKRVPVVRLEKNQGKAAAVRYALRYVQSKYVLLLDADLRYVIRNEVRAAVRRMSKGDMDMIILRRVRAEFPVRFSRGDLLYSGERILRTVDLKKVLSRSISHYQLETAINTYMMQHKKNVGWMPSSARNTYKIVKWGLWRGMLGEFQMYKGLFVSFGIIHVVWMMLMFCRSRIDV